MLAKALQSTAGNAAQQLYVDDVFSTYLYTGNGSTQTITNGIDLAGEGGMVWIKGRFAETHALYDTTRGGGNYLSSDTTSGQANLTTYGLQSFTSSGFTTIGTNTYTYASWTFRKAPKFFDVATYTGDGVAGRQIAHSLGIAPGMIIVKCTSHSTTDWVVGHRSLSSWQNNFLYLNMTADQQSSTGILGDADPTSSTFEVGNSNLTNASGRTYVAYLFAHDTDADGFIQCGSFTTDTFGRATVELGWEPQYVLTKLTTDSTRQWNIFDTMRGFANGTSNDQMLYANASNSEVVGADKGHPTSTGFQLIDAAPVVATGIYLAIRRPNKPPESGTEVYNAIARTGTGAATTVNLSMSPDLLLSKDRRTGSFDSFLGFGFIDKLRGKTATLQAWATGAEDSQPNAIVDFSNTGYVAGTEASSSGFINWSGANYVTYGFARAPGFFDVVCYTGTGVARTVDHNLGVAPEMIIAKRRDSTAYWNGYHSALTGTKNIALNATDAANTTSTVWNDTEPTSSVFTVGTSNPNISGGTYVAYLWATKPGISKVGSYTGNGSTQTIDCGFSTGARFVLIKRTDSTGDWFVWDTARGIVAANDPHLSLNTTAAEVTTDDSIDPDNSGFIVNQNTATNINVSTATYIFLAIA
jgi:hypothetical protein